MCLVLIFPAETPIGAGQPIPQSFKTLAKTRGAHVRFPFLAYSVALFLRSSFGALALDHAALFAQQWPDGLGVFVAKFLQIGVHQITELGVYAFSRLFDTG